MKRKHFQNLKINHGNINRIMMDDQKLGRTLLACWYSVRVLLVNCICSLNLHMSRKLKCTQGGKWYAGLKFVRFWDKSQLIIDERPLFSPSVIIFNKNFRRIQQGINPIISITCNFWEKRLNCYRSRNILLQKLNNYNPIQLIMAELISVISQTAITTCISTFSSTITIF